MDRRIISEYSAGAFAFAIEEAVLEGFTLSTESQFYPCVNGFVYEAIMLTQSWAEEERVNLKSPILAVINCNKGIETQNEAA